MTRLERRVRRLVTQGDAGYVVTLLPAQGGAPPMVEVRERGRRMAYSVPVASLYLRLVDADIAARREARRKGRRKLRRW